LERRQGHFLLDNNFSRAYGRSVQNDGLQRLASVNDQVLGANAVRLRHEYRLDLTAADPLVDLHAPVGMLIRAVSSSDRIKLAELMLDAYRDTIDYEGEGITEALTEVDGYLSRASNYSAVSEHSVVLVFRDTIACACLLEFWQRRGVPFVGFVMCLSAHKRQGLATFALHQTIAELKRAGYTELRTIITEGNAASEALFARAGFFRVDH
jgi:RimJ/RimL family protein N-acetyltransferase